MYCIDPTSSAVVSCETADSLVVVTKMELAQYSPFYLDIESAVAIGGAILTLWAVAFLLRMIRKSIESSTESES